MRFVGAKIAAICRRFESFSISYSHPEGPARHLDASQEKFSPHCLEINLTRHCARPNGGHFLVTFEESPLFFRAACLQNETAPEKNLNRYEKRFEKREKRSEKRSETRLKNV